MFASKDMASGKQFPAAVFAPSSRASELTRLQLRKGGKGGVKGDIWATVRLVGTAGLGFMSDGYDLGVINIALAIMGHLYPEHIGAGHKGLIASATIVGVVIGQLSFGALADVIGRKTASIITSVLMITGAGLSACVFNGTVWNIGMQLIFYRFLLGLGIGGEFPLSAALSMEGQARQGSNLCLSRTQLLIMNGLLFNAGNLMQFVLVLGLLHVDMPLENTWRFVLGFGVVPSVLSLIFRVQMHPPESEEQPDAAATRSVTYQSKVAEVVRQRWQFLVGACLSWFLFNMVCYSLGSFSSLIFDKTLTSEGDHRRAMIRTDATAGLVSVFFAISGSLLCLGIEAHVSRRTLQFIGFLGMSFLLVICGMLINLSDGWITFFYMLFCLVAAFQALLGATTYLIPAEGFPATVRGTFVGWAAASGKLGAAIGTAVFPVAEGMFGLSTVLHGCGIVMMFGCFVTAALTPDRSEEAEEKCT